MKSPLNITASPIFFAIALFLAILPQLAQSEIIQLACVGGDNEADFHLVYDTLKNHDTEAFAQMLIAGKAAMFEKGEIVSVVGHAGFLNSLVQVRKRGEIDSFLLPYEWVKDSAPPEEATKPSDNQANAVATPDPVTSSSPKPKPTPVPVTALSTPKGFNGKVTGIKLFLNQEPTAWIKYYGTNMARDTGGLEYLWYVGRFELRVGFDRKSDKADSVNLSAQPCTQPLTLEEAKELMATVGLKSFQPYFDGAASGSWGHSEGAVHATYRGNQSDDHLLAIETQLLYSNEGFLTE